MKPTRTPLGALALLTASLTFANDASDLKALFARAEGGDVKAQLDLVHRYRDGKGVEKDVKLAMQWAHRAADAGNADAMDFVGHAYQLHPTSATGHPAQRSGNASAPQGADLLKLIDYRRRRSEPGQFAFVPMPHIHQGYNNCGAADCATFARFFVEQP